jgi:Sodium:neurotransmitter symporter family
MRMPSFQVVVVSWVYGFGKTFDNLNEMGMKFNKFLRNYWWLMWVVLTPIFSLVSILFLLFRSTGDRATSIRVDYSSRDCLFSHSPTLDRPSFVTTFFQRGPMRWVGFLEH